MNNPKVHLICNAHLDPVWQWRWEEGCSEALATFRNAVEILHEYDEFIFNHNEAVLYQWVQKYDPRLFRGIQQLVKKEKWFISGGWYLQPDVNLPGTESIIRQIIIGRRYFKEYFNVEPNVAYNFDSFGHSGGLPQILKHAGYQMYIHQRPESKYLDLPAELYTWRGIDGSEITALRIEIGLYVTERDNIEERLSEAIKLARKLNRDVPVFWGLGNHGGGATRKDLDNIRAFIQKENSVKIIHSSTDYLYESLTEAAHNAPVVEGDLQRVFTGCYTSMSRIKRRAVNSLARLVQTEALQTVNWWLFNHEYPRDQLAKSWQDHLFNDFHDILTGSCIQPAEQDALNLYGCISDTLRRLHLGVAVKFNQEIPIQNVYIPVTVLNANPSATKVPVEFECMFDYRPPRKKNWHLKLFLPDRTEITCQEEQPEALLPFHNWRRKICFMSDLPALGATNFFLEPFEGKPDMKQAKPALNFHIDPETGLINELYAKDERQCLSGSLLNPLVIEDKGDSWGTDVWSYRKIIGKFVTIPGSVQNIENGPVRSITETILSYNQSKMIIHTISYSQWPVIEYKIRIHWNEKHKRLKLTVPTKFIHSNLLCEVPGGAIHRPADGQEYVHGRWFVIQGGVDGRQTALAVVNNGQHGIDFKNAEVRLSILRSAAYCHEKDLVLDESPYRKFMDQGIHEIKLLVTAGNPENVCHLLPGLADWLSEPPAVFPHLPIGSIEQKAPGSPFEIKNNKSVDLIFLKPENIKLTACKRSWDGKALIIRLQESTGKFSNMYLEIKFPEIKIKMNFKAFEIKTLRIEKSGKWSEVNLIKEI